MLKVFEADYSHYKTEIRYVRNKVFVLGQNVPEDIEIDGKDGICFHVLLTKNDEPVGTGRMQKDGHIGRIAVLEEYRGMDFGTMIMQKLEEIAVDNGIKRTYLNSQCHAISFYLKLGYEPVGDTFYEAGIEHIKMVKEL
ncbi:MAG: GNAT family N-acetyltransferase [Candidatus Delongbacteria bacterium]|nr:GNAT family N-acetyltransferase [Candidatus Delongbacteria bacterium]